MENFKSEELRRTDGRGPSQKAATDKKRGYLLEAADRSYCSFCEKMVILISNLAIITKRIYYIWIYLIIMSSLLSDFYVQYLLSFS